MSECRLCGESQITFYHQDKRRTYWQCQSCALVFVKPEEFLSSTQEKAIYDSHENALEDLGYRRFLSRAFDPVIERVAPNSKGLDFGCGPGPLLAHMLKEAGHTMSCYDLYYANDPEALTQSYDFITCTEVIEHIAEPKQVLQRLIGMLEKGAPLVLMTKLVIDQSRFSNWHYKNDLTHITFFSRKTFEYVAQHFDCEIEFIGNDVIVLTKLDTPKGMSNKI